jgi:DNA primase
VLTLAITCYQDELFSHPHVLAYVAERAVSTETARHLCLGYSDGESLARRIKSHPWLCPQASAAGLLTNQGRERLACRLIIPEMREQQAVYLIGRIVAPSRSRHKYLGIAIKKCLLGYGEAMRRIMRKAHPVEGILIVEGALDFVLAWQWLLPVCCVALLSTCASQLQLDEIAELHKHITGTPVVVGLDADSSGARVTPLLLSQLQRRGLPTIPLPLIEGVKDIGELGKLPNGRERLLHTLMEAITGWRAQGRSQ